MVPDANNPRLLMAPVSRLRSYRVADLIRGAVGPIPFSVLNYTRKEMEDALARSLQEQQFDIVQLESVHLAGYLPLLRGSETHRRLIVCDWHNIESEVLQRYSEVTPSPARRLYARHAANRLQEYERWFVNQCDMHVVVSDRDRDTLIQYGTKAPIVVVENGVPLQEFGDAAGATPTVSNGSGVRDRCRVLFVGTMDYHANVDAVMFFGREVWPTLRQSLPDCVFTVVGRNPPEEVRKLSEIPGIEVTGMVADVRPYYAEAFVAVVPLRIAGGSRIKILEAMAAGVPVVATSRGAEGLAVIPNTHFLLAETGAAMREAVVSLSQNTLTAARLAQAGRELVRRRYDWGMLGDALAQHLLASLETLAPAAAARAIGKAAQ